MCTNLDVLETYIDIEGMFEVVEGDYVLCMIQHELGLEVSKY